MDFEPWTPNYDYDNDYYDYTNETEDLCQLQDLPHAHWILPTLYTVFFLLGIIGNAVVIAIVSRRSSRRADTFILNLAVSDLLFVLPLPLWASSLAMDGYWPFGVHLCRASGFIIAVTRSASSLLMAIMSVDRYLAVMGGKRVHPLRTRVCSLGACCSVWAVSILTGIPALIFRQLDDHSMACVDSVVSSLGVGLKLAIILFTFGLPFTVVIFCYSFMAKNLWMYFGGQQKAAVGKHKSRHGHNWLRIVTCVVSAYTFSWFPYNALSTVKLVAQLGTGLPCHISVSISQALSAAAALAFANSCTNPLIYSLLDAGFRRRTQLAMPRLITTCRAVFLLPIRGWSLPTTPANTDSSSTFTGSY
ncbi:putative G-protein coupled receptor 25 [Rhinophrynus dorsalis]